MEIPLSKLFGRECLFRDALAENFVTYFLVVISLQKFLGKKLSLQIFVGRSFSSKFGWTGITVLRFSVRISLQRFSGNDFSSNIFGTYFLFRVFVWIMFFFQVVFVRDFFRISLQNCFCTKHLSEQKPFRLDAYYTRHLLHQTPSAPNILHQRRFILKRLLHEAHFTSDTLCTKRLLHQTGFTPKSFHTRHLVEEMHSTEKSVGRNISTTNSLKKNLYKTIIKRNPYWKIFQEKIYKTNI